MAMQVLTIGNSFADNALFYLEKMTAAGQNGVVFGQCNLGGCSLEKHWNLVEQCRAIRDVRPYGYRITGSEPRAATLEEALRDRPWDYVTLQQVSDLSFRAETYFPYIRNLADLVRRLAPSARCVIHETWAYRCDAQELTRYGIDQAEMFRRLKSAYADAARTLGCRIIPSGTAFQKARAFFGYRPDPAAKLENLRYPALPDQTGSLNVGYFWATGNTGSGRAEIRLDGRHGNEKGRYLAGAVWYEMFTGREAAAIPFRPVGVSAEEQRVLCRCAHEAVTEYGGPLTAR